MTSQGDEDLAHLIEREQRGFRTILFAGLVTLVIMALMSAAMGVYFYLISTSLAETTKQLQRDAFQTRRSIDAQSNRLIAQERAIRRAYTDIRIAAGGGAEVPVTPAMIARAREAAERYLLRGHQPSLSDQRALRQFGERDSAAISQQLRALMGGTWALLNFDISGETAAGAQALPPTLQEATSLFEIARTDPALHSLSQVGLASIRFTDAAQRHNYSPEACEQVFAALQGINNGLSAPRPLYWRAQCERKLGRTAAALSNYARSLAASAPVARELANQSGLRRETEAENQLALDAYHGVGTTLIAAADLPEDTPGLAEALETARQWCEIGAEGEGRSPRMALALACLREAIALRRAQGQSENQLSGSGENISFAHLRDGDYDAAFLHAQAVERTGLFAWNEAMRALAASRAEVGSRAERRAALSAARRNVGLFTIGQFNICELEALMNADHFEALRQIIAAEHPEGEVRCTAS